MVFNKKRADDRKDWLENYDRNSYLNTSNPMIGYDEFIHRELIHFSKYDCDRSIPNLMDGLKISLRKILYASFKKRLTTEIKVAQFTGYISEHSCYHHGEASLNQAIVGMAQNFVGSNNINLLEPSGQFGTRLQGGKDSASERYIFTRLNKITRHIFPEEDDNVLHYLKDDGYPVEPIFYTPIIPMILVNGSKGIGTGFSTDIMCYNPRDIIHYLKNKLEEQNEQKENTCEFLPYYEGFQGTIEKINETKFLFKGIYQTVGPDKIRVTELPVGFWTQDFKEHLENLQEAVDKDGKKVASVIKDYDDMSKDTTVDFTITFQKGKLTELEQMKGEHSCNGVEKILKLYSTSSTTNMNLFNASDRLKKYNSVPEIIDDYFETRLEYYGKRKDYLVNALEHKLLILSNKSRYIQEVLDDSIDLRKKKKQEITELLIKKQYDIIDADNEFNYLIKMPMDTVSDENVLRLLKEHKDASRELEIIQSTTIQQMWKKELLELEHVYNEYTNERKKILLGEPSNKKKALKVVKKKDLVLV